MENNKTKQNISMPAAIVTAGFLVMIGLLFTNNNVAKPKTLSEQIGIRKEALTECIKNADLDNINKEIFASADRAMSKIKDGQGGTPYSIIIGKNGVRYEIRGAISYENLKTLTDSAIAGTLENTYSGDITVSEPNDHILGNPNAEIMIIEYSDFECPYCKILHQTLTKIVNESNDKIAWTFRHLPYHQNSFEKAIASDCVAQLKGSEAFWEYADLLFGLLKTGNESISDQL